MKGVFLLGILVVLAFGFAWYVTFAGAAPGELDTAFGNSGIVATDFEGSTTRGSRGYGVVVQGDGKIVVAGWTWNGTNRDIALGRFTDRGSLDTSFGKGGKVTTPIGSTDEIGFSVALQANGKILVGGWSWNGSNRDFALVRYMDIGTLDPGFGTGGIVLTPFGGNDGSGNSVVVQRDGKILVAGVSNNGSNEDIALVRYAENGALDPSFGGGGKVTTDFDGINDLGNSLAVQSDGKIVVVGDTWQSNSEIALVRYTDDGTLDVDFGTGGKVTTSIGGSLDYGQSVVVQRDGKILVAGVSEVGGVSQIALVRYRANGSLDPSFGREGKVTTAFGGGSDIASSVALQSDGKIVVAGWTWNGSDFDIALVRYTDNGALDMSFGTGGKVITPVGIGDDHGLSLALQSDGKIVVAGFSLYPSNRDNGYVVVARYHGGSVAPPLTLRIGTTEASTFTLTLTGWPNATTRIEFTDELPSPTGTAWKPLGAVTLDGEGNGVFTNLSVAPTRYYRAVSP